MWPLRIALLTALFASALVGVAKATTAQEATDAIAIYDAGKQRHADGDLEAAYLLFREADAMYAAALPKYWQAVCLDELGWTKAAIAAYRAFLDAEPARKHSELIDHAEARLFVLNETIAPAKEPPPRQTKPAAKPAERRAPAAPSTQGPTPDPDNRIAMKAAGFTLLGLTVGAGAALVASFEQSHNAASPSHREDFARATQVLLPVTIATALTTAIVLPLSYSEPDGDGDQAVTTRLVVGPSGGSVVLTF